MSDSDRPVLPRWLRRTGGASWALVGMALAVAVVVVLLAALDDLVIPLVIAVVSAVVFAPAVDWLEARRVPRAIGALAVTLMIIGLAVAMIVLVVVGVVDHSDELQEQWDAALAELDATTGSGRFSDFLQQIDVGNASSQVVDGFNATFTTVVGSAVGIVAGTVLSLVLLYYLLKDGRRLMASAIERRGNRDRAQAQRVLAQAGDSLRANGRGRFLLALAQGVGIFLLMLVLRVPLPATIAIVAFVGAFVPYLGAFVGGAFAVVMALSEGGVQLGIATLIAFLFVNLILENLLEPRLIGSQMKMHPIVVLTATVAGGIVAGLLGLILAAPAVAIGTNLMRELRASGFFDSSSDDE